MKFYYLSQTLMIITRRLAIIISSGTSDGHLRHWRLDHFWHWWRSPLALGVGNKRLRRCIESQELLFSQTAPNYCDKNLGEQSNSQYCLFALTLDLSNKMGNLRRRTKINGRGEAAQNPFGVQIRQSIKENHSKNDTKLYLGCVLSVHFRCGGATFI